MRHYMVDLDNEERLLKVPPRVVAAIREDERRQIVERLAPYLADGRVTPNVLRAVMDYPSADPPVSRYDPRAKDNRP